MNRRNAISNIVILTGAAMLPSCRQHDQALVPLKNISVTGSEEKMLIQLAETIIPKTTFIGAADVKAHEFTLMMVDDCYGPDKQKSFTDGLKEFDKLAKKKYGSSFMSCTPAEKTALLAFIEKKQEVPEEVTFFYATTKRHTMQAFTSSKEYMTEVIKYKMVPGSNFKGCVPIKNV